MSKWVVGKITEVKHWTDSLFSIRLMADIAPYLAGQFVKLAVDGEEKKLQRAFSFVNAPKDPVLEFYLVKVQEGQLSPQLHKLNVGDTLWVSHVSTGFFVLDEVPTCDDLWLISTGTGISPFLSILQEGKDLQRFKNIVLIHAVRYAQDLSYLPLMRELEQQYNGKLRIQTITSQEQVTGSLHGRVTTLIENGELEKSVGLNITPQHSHLMLCGNPQMIRDLQTLLKTQREMHKHLRRKSGHITSEHYW